MLTWKGERFHIPGLNFLFIFFKKEDYILKCCLLIFYVFKNYFHLGFENNS